MHLKLIKQVAAFAICIIPRVLSQVNGSTSQMKFNAMRTMSIGFIIYPGFELLDVFGPLEILASLSFFNKMTLSLISAEVGLVPAGAPPHAAVAGSSKSDFGYVLTPQIQSTHSFANAPALDILFVPGGLGIVALEQNNDTTIEDFIAKRYAKLDYLVGVSLGVVGLAKSGVLKGKRATTNKSAWTYVTTTPGHGENITWVPQARWVVDGNIWTTSGIAAGLDAAYALLKQIYGTESLDYMMNVIEYAPHTNPAWDPYAAVFNVSGADTNTTLADCVTPVA